MRVRRPLPRPGRAPVLLAVLCGAALLSFSTGSARLVTVQYHAGWNLVGASEGARYAGADGPMYTLQPADVDYETLPAGTPAVAGWGYWVYFPSARSVSLPEGAPFITVDVPAGRWVLLGNPSGVRTSPVAGADAVYTWDPGRGYQAAASLLPGQGAWAYSVAGGTLTIGLADNGPADAEPSVPDIPAGPVGELDALGCRTGDVLAGVYHATRLQVIAPCRTITGTVATVKVEDDGDYHVNVLLDAGQEDLINQRNRTIQKGALVAEVIPADQRQLPPPLLRDHVRLTGAFVLDRDHGWYELHPVWRAELIDRR